MSSEPEVRVIEKLLFSRLCNMRDEKTEKLEKNLFDTYLIIF